MKLRSWQRECIETALTKFSKKQSHFFCLATPGAGKTFMAAELANQLFKKQKIDLAICFSPSIVVSQDFKLALENHTGLNFSGELGSAGVSLCYHAMQSLSAHFWSLIAKKRVFVICDEIHHCAGNTQDESNAWGEQLLSHIQGKAAYTLALTGTPWRSDKISIALTRYCQNSFKVHCDYSYGLQRAIEDGVCRVPKITAFDNNKITTKKEHVFSTYRSFEDLLENSDCTFKDVIEHPDVIRHSLFLAIEKLNKLRQRAPESGGLVVAASIEHANKILIILKGMGETAQIVTYKEKKPSQVIQQFKNSEEKWIVSVGMISEGTNIPRLIVCCFLSMIKTELYFRQVLGRVMRIHKSSHEIGYFFMPAHPLLVEFAERLQDDIPECNAVDIKTTSPLVITPIKTTQLERFEENVESSSKSVVTSSEASIHGNLYSFSSALDKSYDYKIDSFGKFKQVVLAL